VNYRLLGAVGSASILPQPWQRRYAHLTNYLVTGLIGAHAFLGMGHSHRVRDVRFPSSTEYAG
jgi:hypothetical protein